jgi:anhydro-N-acetylmuramic acid kinase
VERIETAVAKYNIAVMLPAAEVINYKEALIMALLGVLRWREENTALASVTGATRSSIGGAVWIGQEA